MSARDMVVIRDGAPAPAHLRGGVVALGNFDGFHRGHQAVVGRAREIARSQNRPLLVCTFDPHPARLFRPDAPPFALTSMAQRLELFAAFGVDAAVVLPFTPALAAETADSFVADWLVARLAPSRVVTGWDFTFGAKRSGDTAALAQMGTLHGFTAEALPPVLDAGQPVSSSRIRAALAEGDCPAAAHLLTRPFTIRGQVEHGAKLGRQLGFPTANVTLGDYLRPRYGVYAVRATLDNGAHVGGVANLGVRPMFDPPVELLETYLMDWSGDLYGRTVDIALAGFVRPEWKLDGLDALTRQIAIDTGTARSLLAD